MVIGTRLAWIAIASVVGLLVVGFVTYFAVNAGDSSGGAPTVQQTTTAEVPTTPPPLTEIPTETALAPTEGPTVTTEVPTTAVPTLSPPPPRPATPLPLGEGSLTGGRWYTLPYWCVTFYVPGGYSFGTDSALADPGGYTSLALIVIGADGAKTKDYIAFRTDKGSEVGRRAQSPGLRPVFDQIAATFSPEC